ncbi:uncharacterized protein [Triticum aestivum]|uniref:uncharacterized protein n=1 Tax=Triticum aestivum TaxID=4565 RepID=UPI001D00DD86|nr:uncharacterized protein LOC123171549 [Triticum aestivum]
MRARRCRWAALHDPPASEGIILGLSSLKKKINDSSTMLLYELPSGFAIISFDGVDLTIPMKDLWAYPPQNVRLEGFKKFEEKSTAIDLTNGVVGKDLSEMLTKFCGSEQKLLVGQAEYKRIIEGKLDITCQYDNIVEELIWGLDNIMHTLLPEEASEPKEYRPPRGKGLILFLHQYGFVVQENSVTGSIVEKARLLYHLELNERQYLKLLCRSIKKFIDVSSLTKRWSLLKFGTALKFLCYPEESYEVWGPHKMIVVCFTCV